MKRTIRSWLDSLGAEEAQGLTAGPAARVILDSLSRAPSRTWHQLVQTCDAKPDMPKSPPAYGVLALLVDWGLVAKVGDDPNSHAQPYELPEKGREFRDTLT